MVRQQVTLSSPTTCPAPGRPQPRLRLLQAQPHAHSMDQGVIKGRDTTRNSQASHRAEVWAHTVGVRMLRVPKQVLGDHHSGTVDLSPSESSVARNYKEQGNKYEKWGVLVHTQHCYFSCNSGTRWTGSHSRALAVTPKAALLLSAGWQWVFWG